MDAVADELHACRQALAQAQQTRPALEQSIAREMQMRAELAAAYAESHALLARVGDLEQQLLRAKSDAVASLNIGQRLVRQQQDLHASLNYERHRAHDLALRLNQVIGSRWHRLGERLLPLARRVPLKAYVVAAAKKCYRGLRKVKGMFVRV